MSKYVEKIDNGVDVEIKPGKGVKMQKYKSFFLIALLLLSLVTAAFAAEDSGLVNDIVNSVKNGIIQWAQNIGLVPAEPFKDKKEQVKQEILNYGQTIKQQLQSELQSYVQQLINERNQELEDTKNGVKRELDAQKSQISNEMKNAIKEDLDAKFGQVKKQLRDEIINDLSR